MIKPNISKQLHEIQKKNLAIGALAGGATLRSSNDYTIKGVIGIGKPNPPHLSKTTLSLP